MAECRVKRALLSVSDKTGIVEFAKGLNALGVEIVSTGGTHKALTDAGIPVLYIADVTGFPEILDGRVKTLHPAVHGGILARRGDPAHMKALSEQNITPVDLVAVNLYPFRQTAARRGVSWEDLIENIDIGGPSMVRSAAKNHEDVVVAVHPEDYENILRCLKDTGDCPKSERVRLALAAFRHTAEYDACISETLSARCNRNYNNAQNTAQPEDNFPESVTLTLAKLGKSGRNSRLRYGENPGQAAAVYRSQREGRSFIDAAQLQGKELSYNNWLDSDSAFRIIQELNACADTPTAVVVKHTNPCGAAVGATVEEAFSKAYSADLVSAFGGIVAVNRPVSGEMALMLQKFFQEVVVAPAYTKEARDILSGKPNLRLLEVPEEAWRPENAIEWRSIQGGLLAQERDLQPFTPGTWEIVTKQAPADSDWSDLKLAWALVKHVKSNAIALVKGGASVGIGAGQPNRVGAAEIAFKQAGENARGAVLASDAFFPFADTVRLAARHGVSVIVQPGGSVRDAESIDAANELGVAMLFTGVRHFKH